MVLDITLSQSKNRTDNRHDRKQSQQIDIADKISIIPRSSCDTPTREFRAFDFNRFRGDFQEGRGHPAATLIAVVQPAARSLAVRRAARSGQRTQRQTRW